MNTTSSHGGSHIGINDIHILAQVVRGLLKLRIGTPCHGVEHEVNTPSIDHAQVQISNFTGCPMQATVYVLRALTLVVPILISFS